MFKKFTPALLFTLSFPLLSGTVTNLKSQNRVTILKVIDNYEVEIIEEMRRGKIVESCMKIADAYNASIDLEIITKKDLYQLKGQLLTAKTDCSILDLVKLDELYLKRISRHLALVKETFKKL